MSLMFGRSPAVVVCMAAAFLLVARTSAAQAPVLCQRGSGETAVAAAIRCAGWIKVNSEKDPLAPQTPKPSAPVSTTELPGVGPSSPLGGGIAEVANDIFSIIAQIAVDRAQQAGLALVQQKLETGVCGLKQPGNPAAQLLPHTCALVRSTELQALVSQGRALRAAISGDVVALARKEVDAKLDAAKLPPLKSGGIAAFDLLERVVADPQGRLTKTDVWMPLDTFLNTEWGDDTKTETAEIDALQVATASARVYFQAAALQTKEEKADQQPIDLGYIIRYEIQRCGKLDNCKRLTADVAASVLPLASLAVRAGASIDSTGAEDLRDELRSTLQLLLRSLLMVQVPASPWVLVATNAALDADAPQLIASLAEMAGDILDKCEKDCAQRRKVAALLTGISTYAIAYEHAAPAGDAAQQAALEKQRQEARKSAVEAVINAATDRRGRGGDWVWSLGAGIGVTLPTYQQLDDDTKTRKALQLHLPVGVALQKLPGLKYQVHLMLNFLDLGNYVATTGKPATKPDWQAIIAPGFELGIPLSKAPNNFFVAGVTTSYIPRFVSADQNGAFSQGAWRAGGFLHFYFSLWDFN